MTTFGLDTGAVTGMDLMGDLVDDKTGKVQAVCRRWITPRGALDWGPVPDPNYGTDVRQFISDTAPEGLIASAMINEALKEDGITGCEITPKRIGTRLEIKGKLVGDDLTCEFSFALDDAGISKLTVA
jgi:hypothetical protein